MDFRSRSIAFATWMTFVIWSHREKELVCLLDYVSCVFLIIQFTMEKEADDRLAFLDVLVLKWTNGNLCLKMTYVCTKNQWINVDRYLYQSLTVTQSIIMQWWRCLLSMQWELLSPGISLKNWSTPIVTVPQSWRDVYKRQHAAWVAVRLHTVHLCTH